MIIFVTLVGLLVIGVELTLRVWPSGTESSLRSFERLTYAAIFVGSFWLATTWALALLFQLTRPVLGVRAALVGVVAAILIVRRFRASPPTLSSVRRKVPIPFALALLPLVIWVTFILWRGAVVPPLSHDALSYHLPKAVMFARAHGFAGLRELDPRQRNIPANYEMLLSEYVVTQQSDTYSEWPSAAFFLLFAAGCAALAERWSKTTTPTAPLAVFLLAAGLPVVLLHSGAHKNDLMVASFTVASMVAAARFLSERKIPALILCLAATALAIGTKPQAAAVAGCLAPFIVWRLRARPGLIAVIAVFGVATFPLLGGATYLANLLRERAVVGTMKAGEAVIAYGDWANLWEGPYVLLAAPFSASATELEVPWRSEPWFWRRNEIYFSHLGIPFAFCALAAPFCALRFWRQDRAKSLEKAAVTLAGLGALVAMLPVVFKPHGMYAISLPRYALFVVPVVFGWTVVPLIDSVRSRVGLLLLTAAAGVFGLHAANAAIHDDFVPLEYVAWANEHRQTRVVPFDANRAASVVDRMASPRDLIALDATYASWIHPAYGADLTRPVAFIPPGAGPPQIPETARWVAIDRLFTMVWQGKGFDDLSQARTHAGTGEPSEEDLRVYEYLRRDPRWELVFQRRGALQFVFRRVQ